MLRECYARLASAPRAVSLREAAAVVRAAWLIERDTTIAHEVTHAVTDVNDAWMDAMDKLQRQVRRQRAERDAAEAARDRADAERDAARRRVKQLEERIMRDLFRTADEAGMSGLPVLSGYTACHCGIQPGGTSEVTTTGLGLGPARTLTVRVQVEITASKCRCLARRGLANVGDQGAEPPVMGAAGASGRWSSPVPQGQVAAMHPPVTGCAIAWGCSRIGRETTGRMRWARRSPVLRRFRSASGADWAPVVRRVRRGRC